MNGHEDKKYILQKGTKGNWIKKKNKKEKGLG